MIYVIYECDQNRSKKSTAIKFMTADKVKAEIFYRRILKEYQLTYYTINLSKYNPLLVVPDSNSNALNDCELIETSEK
jgi:hypothetical protein